MIHCSAMQERMPEAVHGAAPWSVLEQEHVASCAECAAVWRLVEAGAALHCGVVVNTAAVSERLRARVAISAAEVRRLPWRGRRVGFGALAAAASIALFFGVRSGRPTRLAPSAMVQSTGVLPELAPLSESQLEAVLATVDQSESEGAVSPMRIPRLGDLTENQLELVLRELEG